MFYIFTIGGGAASIYQLIGTFPQQPSVLDFKTSEQINKLEEIQGALNNLQDFISIQKNKLKITQKNIDELEKEKEKIEPVVKAGKKVIESVLEIHQENIQKNAVK